MSTFALLQKLCFIFIGGTCIYKVQATVLTENLALNKQSYLSDTDGVYAAYLANDGKIADGLCSKTLYKSGYWEVDLGGTYLIDQIKVYNTNESCCSGDLQSVKFLTTTSGNNYILRFTTEGPAVSVYTWTPVGTLYARWIQITRKPGIKNQMIICEVEVFGREVNWSTGIPPTTVGSVTTTSPLKTVGSVTTTSPLKTQLFIMNNQRRAAGEVINITLAKSEKHCCFMCLATMTTNGCESVNYDKVTGECSLVKGLTTEEDANDDTVMLTPAVS